MENYLKKKIFIEGQLQGLGYFHALRAIRAAEKLHSGFRKDKVTPEFEHQISQIGYALTLKDQILFPEETICTIAFHDTVEDKDKSARDIYDMLNGPKEVWAGAERTIDAVLIMSKEIHGIKKAEIQYYNDIGFNPIASIAKPIDRWHNFGSMNNKKVDGNPVFNFDKQRSYISEYPTHFEPMFKTAENLFPEQFNVYMNIKTVLKMQIDFVKCIIGD